MRHWTAIIVLLGMLACGSAMAQAPADAASVAPNSKPLVVGVTVAPPFVIKDADGYEGMGIDLWQDIATAKGWQFQYRPYDLKGLLDAVQHGKVDVALGALTTTAERERVMDFAHPIVSTGLGIAVRSEGGSGWLTVVQALVSPAFLKVIGTLALLLLIVGFLVWLVEHQNNADEFGGSRAHGIFSGFWWAMVTMTTVGYGDTAPRSVPGRVLGLIWMLTALVVVSSFTAAIASALTVGKLQSGITSASDLRRVRVASLDGSTSGAWMNRHSMEFMNVDSLDAALAQLAAGKVDAVVYDKPLLSWKIQQAYTGSLRVLPLTLERQDYAFGLPPASPLREPIDTELLEHINSSDWKGFVKSYLGSNT